MVVVWATDTSRALFTDIHSVSVQFVMREREGRGDVMNSEEEEEEEGVPWHFEGRIV